MRKELQDKIYERFPNWFNTKTAPYHGGFYGFEIGDGWFDIIWELLEKLEPIVVRYPDFQVVQVKEKFGGLRFYVNHCGEQVDAYLCVAEEKASTTCEVCGQPGKLRGKGWLKTLCQTHYEARESEKEGVNKYGSN